MRVCVHVCACTHKCVVSPGCMVTGTNMDFAPSVSQATGQSPVEQSMRYVLRSPLQRGKNETQTGEGPGQSSPEYTTFPNTTHCPAHVAATSEVLKVGSHQPHFYIIFSLNYKFLWQRNNVPQAVHPPGVANSVCSNDCSYHKVLCPNP